MRWQLLAIAAAVGFSGQAAAQYPLPTPYYPQPPVVWQPVRTRWVDNHCVPTRVVYLAPRPITPPVYPVPVPVPVPMPVPVVNPLAQAMPPFQFAAVQQPQPAPAQAAAPQPLPVQPILGNASAPPAAAPRRAAVPSGPRLEQTASKPAQDASPEEEASRKLKLARYLEQDGLMDKARQRYEEIVRLYPGTPAATEARAALGQGG